MSEPIVKCHLCDHQSDHVREDTREGHTVYATARSSSARIST